MKVGRKSLLFIAFLIVSLRCNRNHRVCTQSDVNTQKQLREIINCNVLHVSANTCMGISPNLLIVAFLKIIRRHRESAKTYIRHQRKRKATAMVKLTVDKESILEIVQHCLARAQVEHSVVLWNKRVLKKNEEIKAGPQIIKTPFDGTILFVDLSPKTNWAHPCLYLIVSNQTRQTLVVESSYPPIMDPPENYVAILSFGRAVDEAKQQTGIEDEKS